MIIRILAGLVIAPAAAIGALYGASMVFTPPVSSSEAALDGEAMMEAEAPVEAAPETQDGGMAEDEPMGEPPIPLPYGDGEAAIWLVDLLEGTGPYPLTNADGEADLAALAAEAASGGAVSAECQTSHVSMICHLREDGGDRYSFGVTQTGGAYRVDDDGVSRHEGG